MRPADAARSAQSIAARRAALAKRSSPGDEPLVITLDEPAPADDRHLTLLPDELTLPAPAPAGPRWGESPARAS